MFSGPPYIRVWLQNEEEATRYYVRRLRQKIDLYYSSSIFYTCNVSFVLKLNRIYCFNSIVYAKTLRYNLLLQEQRCDENSENT